MSPREREAMIRMTERLERVTTIMRGFSHEIERMTKVVRPAVNAIVPPRYRTQETDPE